MPASFFSSRPTAAAAAAGPARPPAPLLAVLAALLALLAAPGVTSSIIDATSGLTSPITQAASGWSAASAEAPPGSTGPVAETRVRASTATGGIRVGPETAGSAGLHPGRTVSYDQLVSGWLVAPRAADAVSQARFARGRWLTHFEKHGAPDCWGGNCLGYANSVDYLRGAQSLTRGGRGVETFTRKSGDTLFYRSATNEFGVLSPDNVIRTYFKPDDGYAYWLQQIGGG